MKFQRTYVSLEKNYNCKYTIVLEMLHNLLNTFFYDKRVIN